MKNIIKYIISVRKRDISIIKIHKVSLIQRPEILNSQSESLKETVDFKIRPLRNSNISKLNNKYSHSVKEDYKTKSTLQLIMDKKYKD